MSFAVNRSFSDFIRISTDVTVTVAEIQSINWNKSGNISISVNFWESIDDIGGAAKAQRTLDLTGQTSPLSLTEAQQAVLDNIATLL